MKTFSYLVLAAAIVGLLYVLFGLPIAPVSLQRIVIDGTRAPSIHSQEPQSAENKLVAYNGAEKRYQRFREVHFRVVIVAVISLVLLCLISWYSARKS